MLFLKYLCLLGLLSPILTGELELEGDLKVTGNIDANGNAINNVGEPVLTTDVATANYVNSRTSGKGRIITLKCGWVESNGWLYVPGIGSCTPPSCPDGWDDLAVYTENTAASGASSNSQSKNILYGNSVRLCIEQEDEE